MCFRFNKVILVLLLLFVSACQSTKWNESPEKQVGIDYTLLGIAYPACIGKDVTKWNNCAGKIIKDKWQMGHDPLGLHNLYIDEVLIGVYQNGMLNGPSEWMHHYRGGKYDQVTKINCTIFYKDNLKHGYEKCTESNAIGGRFTDLEYKKYKDKFSKKFYVNGLLTFDPETEEQAVEEASETEAIVDKEIISDKMDIGEAKLQCKDIGFTEGTESFGKCVLDLTK